MTILPGTGRGTGEAGGGGRPRTHRPEVVLARKLRRDLTLPEVMLWERLRGRRCGVRFRRQHPIGPYVADFCCNEARLVVEIDGEAHARGDRPAADARRDRFMADNGYRVLRFAGAEVLRDGDGVAAAIAAIAASPLHQPAAGPPPRTGEE